MSENTETFHPLQFTQVILEEQGYSTELLTKAEGAAVEMLLVVLRGTDDERYVLEIMYVDDVIEAMGFDEDLETSVLLQFLVRLPVNFGQDRAGDLALLLSNLSRVIPAGTLGISHKDGMVYFRYGLHLPAKNVEANVLTTIVLSTEVFLGMFMPIIQKVAAAELTAEEALDKLEEEGLSIPGIARIDAL